MAKRRSGILLATTRSLSNCKGIDGAFEARVRSDVQGSSIDRAGQNHNTSSLEEKGIRTHDVLTVEDAEEMKLGKHNSKTLLVDKYSGVSQAGDLEIGEVKLTHQHSPDSQDLRA
jgi:hypothetical protein